MHAFRAAGADRKGLDAEMNVLPLAIIAHCNVECVAACMESPNPMNFTQAERNTRSTAHAS